MSEIRIPQYCCATCTFWKHDPAFGFIGTCTRNFVANPTGNSPLNAQTLDLQLCSGWEKSEEAEKAMYGR